MGRQGSRRHGPHCKTYPHTVSSLSITYPLCPCGIKQKLFVQEDFRQFESLLRVAHAMDIKQYLDQISWIVHSVQSHQVTKTVSAPRAGLMWERLRDPQLASAA